MDQDFPQISLREAEIYAPASLFLPAWVPEGLQINPNVTFLEKEDSWPRRLTWSYQSALHGQLVYAVTMDVSDQTIQVVAPLMKKKWGYQVEDIRVSDHKGFLASRSDPKNSEVQVDVRLVWLARGHQLALITKDGRLTTTQLLRIANSIAL
jgi:hypothetical protein